MAKAGYSVNKFAEACGISKTQILRLLKGGVYPARMGQPEAKRRITAALTSRGLDVSGLGSGPPPPTTPPTPYGNNERKD